ncbi:ubiquitin domain-containing protein 7SL RNA1-like isoform X2 [Castanea sativa]|uniref:ubiquitin domain-containing protein 7SL RNA1-like isoform X2 n=1 Tax=Castanea sativa TaxID=21020 RepID=UPI003F6536E5
MDVIFEPQRGRPFSIEVGFFDTILEIKEKVKKYQGIPVSKQTLIFNGNVLKDDLNVEHTEILQNSHIQLMIAASESDKSPDNSSPSPTAASPAAMAALSPSPGPGPTTLLGSKKLKLLVLPKCGTKKIPVEMNASDNVGELRKELQKLQEKLQFSLPQEGYFFIYKQNVMDDDRSFRWHHVGQGDTIEVFNGSVTGGS